MCSVTCARALKRESSRAWCRPPAFTESSVFSLQITGPLNLNTARKSAPSLSRHQLQLRPANGNNQREQHENESGDQKKSCAPTLGCRLRGCLARVGRRTRRWLAQFAINPALDRLERSQQPIQRRVNQPDPHH